MDIIDKLKKFESDLPLKNREPVLRKESEIEQYVPGEEVTNEYGNFFRCTTVYPEDRQQGRIPLNLVWETDPEIFSVVGKDDTLRGIDFRKTIFIDTETTGLAGGAGTVPFLVGIGYFVEDGFQIEQFFMRDYFEERAVLEAVKEKLENCQALSSYNGKCYDLNLLSSRFTLARMSNPAENLPHLDLLFTVRRLWRRRIVDCSLTNIEQTILGFQRNGDVPSYLIPSFYFEYLHTGECKPLVPVFKHNRWDILTLAALAAMTGRIYQYPREHLDHPLDLISLGKALEGMFRLQEAAVCFREALNYQMEPEDRNETLGLLGLTLKRLGQWDKAVKVWEYMVETVPRRITPYEELAKYYEHRAGNFKRAIEVVNRALERIVIVEELYPDLNLGSDSRDLEYRLARLKRKLNAKKQKI